VGSQRRKGVSAITRVVRRERGVGRAAGVIGLALLAAACGSTGSTGSQPPQHSAPAPPASVNSATVGTPTVTVSPDTGLAAGQQVQVTLTGYPRGATVSIHECADAAVARRGNECTANSSSVLYTANSGSATGPFVAQPAAAIGSDGHTVRCRQQCVLVALVIKLDGPVPPSTAPVATSRLAFSTFVASPLADADLQSMSWTSATDGWALAAQPCTRGSCVRLAHTTDGGAHWLALADPPALFQDGAVNCGRQSCIAGLYFASSTVGYLFGPALLVTTDGGHTWRRDPGLQTEMLSVADGQVYRVAFEHDGCPGPCNPILQQAAIGSTDWRTLNARLVPPDRSGASQLVASGSTLLLALYGAPGAPVTSQADLYRSANGGQSWQPLSDPCAGRGAGRHGEYDLTDLEAASDGFLAALCTQHTDTGVFVLTSTDGGALWKSTGLVRNGRDLAVLAVASPTALAVATTPVGGEGLFTARLLVSTDAGQSWRTVATDRQQLTQAGVPAWLEYAGSKSGEWLGDPHHYWTTRDGGRHWTEVAFG
jgi:photosystem II stability/assembly factor-like uncharacterized protein